MFRPRVSRRAVAAAAAIALATGLTGCAGAVGASGGGDAASFPDGKPITLIIGWKAGGPTDVGARQLSKNLEKELGTQVVVENKPGATGQVGFSEVARAKPDGYTLGMVNYPSTQTSYLDKARKADYTREDFATLGNHVSDPRAVIIPNDAPYKDLKGLIKAAKEKPNKITVGTAGRGAGSHFGIIQMEDATGMDLRLAHFADGSASSVAAFLGGHIDILVASVSELDDVVKNGKGKVVGVMSEERSPFLPDAPTLEEQGFKVYESGQRGYVAPAGTPKEILDKLEAAIGKVIQSEDDKKALKQFGLETHYLNAKQFADDWKASEQKYSALLPKLSRP